MVNITAMADRASGARQRRKLWSRFVRVVAMVVVFCTTYALILPAITMESKAICGQMEHTHTAECYETVEPAKCTLVESEGHTHSEACYTYDRQLTCALEEGEDHTHGDDCYNEVSTLVCTEPESEGHSHADDVVEPVLVLTCELEEHVHTAECYPETEPTEESTDETTLPAGDPNADLETAKDWEKSLSSVELTGKWHEDVLAVAQSQLGYKESTANYQLTEDGSAKGITRYGQWYGDPYGDWCAMFVSFCVHYAEIPEETFPLFANCQKWVDELDVTEEELLEAKDAEDRFFTPEEYTAVPGDLIFFDFDQDETSDHIGLVVENIAATEETPAQIKVIEGNSDNRVQYVTYDLDSEDIVGYGVLPTEPSKTYSYSDNDVQVDVALPLDSTVPADAVLKVTPIEEKDDGYDDLVQQAEETVDGSVKKIKLYDISFYTEDQEYIPVDDRAQVSMRFVEAVVDTAADVAVLHYDENDAAPTVLEEVSVEDQAADAETVVTFETEGFSVFAVVEVETQTVTFVPDLGGKVFVLTNLYDGSAMTSAAVAGKNNLMGQKDLTFPVEDTTQLWGFIDATTENTDDGLYYIQSVSNGKYLKIDGEGLTFTDKNDRQAMQAIYYNGAVWIRLPGGNSIDYRMGDVAYGAWPKGTPGTNNLFQLTQVVLPLADLDGRTFVISNPKSGRAVISETIMAKNDNGSDDVYILNQQKYTAGQVVADQDLLWTFEDATPDNPFDSVYNIKADDGTYLHIDTEKNDGDRAVTLEEKEQDIELVDVNGSVWIRATTDDGSYITLDYFGNGFPNTKNGFGGWPNANPGDYQLFQLTEASLSNLTDLDGRTFVMTCEYGGSAMTSNTVGDNHLQGVMPTFPVEDKTQMWTFIDATPGIADDGQYFIKSVDNGKYLKIEGTGLVFTDTEDQELQVSNYNGAVWIRVPDGNSIDYLQGNAGVVEYGAWNKGNNPEINNLFQLTEVWPPMTGLDGKTFVMTNLSDGKAMSNVSVASGDDKHLQGMDPTFPVEDRNLMWTFIDATPENPDDGMYYIRSDVKGRYLKLDEDKDHNGLNFTLEDGKQQLQVINYNGSVWIRIPGGKSIDYRKDGTNQYGSWDKGNNPGDNNLFKLTEVSTDYYENMITNLDGKTLAIVAVNNVEDHAAVSSTMATENIEEKTALVSRRVDKDKDGVNFISSDEKNDLVWKFESAGQPGLYYIKAANNYGGSVENGVTVSAAGKYLTITKEGLALSDEAVEGTVIEVVPATNTGVKNAVCLRSKIDDTYCYLSLYFDNVDENFTVDYSADWGNTDNGGNQFVLTKLSSDNELDGKVVAIIAVDNSVDNSGDAKPENYAAVSSTAGEAINSTVGDVQYELKSLVSRDVTKLRDEFVISDKVKDEENNNEETITYDIYDVYWQFESTGEPDHYNVKAVSFYGGTAANANKYLTITKAGLGLTNDPNAAGADIEVVSADGGRELGDDTVCLRTTTVDGEVIYLSLFSDGVGSDFTSNFDPKWATTGDGGNHFVLSCVNDIAKLVDSIPKDSEELEALVGPLGLGDEDFDYEVQYRDALLRKVDYLMDCFNKGEFETGQKITALEKNFYYDQVEAIYNWLHRTPEVVDPVNVAATVKLFNYDSTVNSLFEGSPLPGYLFWQDSHGDGDHSHGADISEDGTGGYAKTHDKVFSLTLDENGYPQYSWKAVQGGTEGTSNLDLLFNDSKYQVSTMSNGGGLFQQDADGYYYYYSDLNAASFDEGDKSNPNDDSFILYDAIVRPEYQALTDPSAGQYYYEPVTNFLPFNPIMNEDGTTNVIYDYDYETGEYSTTGSYSNSTTKPNTTYLNDEVDLWFGMSMEINFLQPKGGISSNNKPMTFDFHGDDDVFVYIDDVLVLNLSGAHAAWDGKIDFSNGIVQYEAFTDDPNDGDKTEIKETTLKKLFLAAAEESENIYIDQEDPNIIWVNGKKVEFKGDTFADFTSHKLNFFYMERGGNISFCGIKFNLMALPQESLAVTKTVKDLYDNPVNDQTYYTFRILEAKDYDGVDDNKTIYDPFFDDTLYSGISTFEIWENGENTGKTGYIDPATGMFSLKAGQMAVFPNLLDRRQNDEQRDLIVEEIIYNDKTKQYDHVEMNGQTVQNSNLEAERWGLSTGDMVYTSSRVDGGIIDAAYGGGVDVVNVVKDTSTLQISKEQTTNAGLEDMDFEFHVLLGDYRIVSSAEATALVDEGEDPVETVDVDGNPINTHLDLFPVAVGTDYTVTTSEIVDGEVVTQTTVNKKVETEGIITLKVGETATFSGLVVGTNYQIFEKVPEVTDGVRYAVDSYKVNGNKLSDTSGVTGEITTTGETVTVVVTNKPLEFSLDLHISKQVLGFSNEDTFAFEVKECNFDEDTRESTPIDDGKTVPTTVKVSGNDIYSDTAVIDYESDDEGIHYYSITELNNQGNYIFDTSEYVAKVDVSENSASMVALWKIVHDGDQVKSVESIAREGDEDSGEFPITFVNYGTYATVSKEVIDGDKTHPFEFKATVEYDPNINFTWPSSDKYEVTEKPKTEDGKNCREINFKLTDGSSVTFPLPAGCDVYVSEIDYAGYTTTVEVNDGVRLLNRDGHEGSSINVSGQVTFKFTNEAGYELPESGGIGTLMYTMGGMFTMAAPVVYGFSKRRRRERRAD